MAPSASAEPLIEMARLEVTKVAGRFRHLHVRALHDLTMTARATELFSPAGLTEMRLVIERDAVEIDAAGKQPGLMAAGTKAACVRDLCCRRGPSLRVTYFTAARGPAICLAPSPLPLAGSGISCS